jgi:single stranded DNA-binding protein
MTNKVTLIGRLGQDPVVITGKTGAVVTKMRVATNSFKKSSDGSSPQEITTWHDISVFGKLGQTCAQWLAKGREVAIFGRLENRKRTLDNGISYTETSVVAEQVHFFGKGGNKNPHYNDVGSKKQKSSELFDTSSMEDDIPDSWGSQEPETKLSGGSGDYPINSSLDVLVENGLLDDDDIAF